MKIDFNDYLVQKALLAFLGFGALSYACMFVAYIMWFMGNVSQVQSQISSWCIPNVLEITVLPKKDLLL